MKTIIKIALILSAIAFATVANATTSPVVVSTGLTTSHSASDQDSAHADFVTVGSTMPYQTTVFDVGAWNNLFTSDGWNFNTPAGGAITGLTSWSVTPHGEDASWNTTVAEGGTIYVTWPETHGEFLLRVTNSLRQGTGEFCAGNNAYSTKRVFVLPRPSIYGGNPVTGSNVIICPADMEGGHPLVFTGRGIGQLRVRYVVESRSVDAPAGAPWASVAITTDRPAPETRDELFRGTWSTARDLYTTSSGNTNITVRVNNLVAGYVYRVRIRGVSDQISRKSFTTGYLAYGPETDLAVAYFAVAPNVTSTKINHVSNEAGTP